MDMPSIGQSEDGKIEAVMVLTSRADPLPMSTTKDKSYRDAETTGMAGFGQQLQSFSVLL